MTDKISEYYKNLHSDTQEINNYPDNNFTVIETNYAASSSKEDQQKESATQVKKYLKKIDDNNSKNYLYSKLIIISLSYLKRFEIPNIQDVAKDIVQITYQKLLSGKRIWYKKNCPSLEEQFIKSTISETRNFCKKHIKNSSRFIADANPPNQERNKPKEPEHLLFQQKTPEQHYIDNEINKIMSLFLDFLKQKDKEAYLITVYFHQYGIDPRETKILAKKMNLNASSINNAKRRLSKLMLEFKAQHEGDLS